MCPGTHANGDVICHVTKCYNVVGLHYYDVMGHNLYAQFIQPFLQAHMQLALLIPRPSHYS